MIGLALAFAAIILALGTAVAIFDFGADRGWWPR